MNYVLKPLSLQQIASVKIVAELWNKEHINTETAQFHLANYNNFVGDFQKVLPGHKILDKISTLQIPKKIKENLETLVNPLGFQIWNWWIYHSMIGEDIALKIPKKLCWTSHGAVENKQTAELIVKDESVDIETRYVMACMYCLEKEIPILWARIPETRQKRFYYFKEDIGLMDMYPRLSDLRNLVTFWTWTINDKIEKLQEEIRSRSPREISVYRFAFDSAVCGGNKTASQYFFDKLSDEEVVLDMSQRICQLLDKFILPSCKAETLVFILNRMNEKQQEKVFRNNAYDAMNCLLCWPYQSFFTDTAKKWICILDEEGYYDNLLTVICDQIFFNNKDDDFKELFSEFWQLCSVNCENFFLNGFALWNILQLFEAGEKCLVKYVLDQMSDFQKNQFLHMKVYEDNHLISLIDEEKFDFLKFLMSECNISLETIRSFKRNVELQLSTEEDSVSKFLLTQTLKIVEGFIH